MRLDTCEYFIQAGGLILQKEEKKKEEKLQSPMLKGPRNTLQVQRLYMCSYVVTLI